MIVSYKRERSSTGQSTDILSLWFWAQAQRSHLQSIDCNTLCDSSSMVELLASNEKVACSSHVYRLLKSIPKVLHLFLIALSLTLNIFPIVVIGYCLTKEDNSSLEISNLR